MHCLIKKQFLLCCKVCLLDTLAQQNAAIPCVLSVILLIVDTSTGLSRIRSDIESSRLRSELDARKDKKDVFASKRLSFADPVSGCKRHDRLTLERDLDEASTQVHILIT